MSFTFVLSKTYVRKRTVKQKTCSGSQCSSTLHKNLPYQRLQVHTKQWSSISGITFTFFTLVSTRPHPYRDFIVNYLICKVLVERFSKPLIFTLLILTIIIAPSGKTAKQCSLLIGYVTYISLRLSSTESR